MSTPRALALAAYVRARDALAAARTPAAAAAAAQAAFEEAWQAAQPVVAAAGALACGPGCAACCHQPVAILPAEGAAIAAHLAAAFDPALRAALQARIAGAVGARAGTPCPFLDPAGRCSIYAVRPLRCRGVHSRRRSACGKWTAPEAAHDTAGAFPAEPLALADAALAGLGRALAEAGWPAGSADLAATLAASTPAA